MFQKPEAFWECAASDGDNMRKFEQIPHQKVAKAKHKISLWPHSAYSDYVTEKNDIKEEAKVVFLTNPFFLSLK